MKVSKIVGLVLAVVILVVLMLGTACNGVTNSAATKAIYMMKKIPEDANLFFGFTDVKAIRADDALNDIYDPSVISIIYEFVGYGVQEDEIEHYVISFNLNGTVSLIEGNFNLDKLRDGLKNDDYNKEMYEGMEVWTDNVMGVTWVVLLDNLIITGSNDRVKDCLGVIKDGKNSLYDSSDVKSVIDRLPDGLWTTFDGGDIYAEATDGLEARGMSFEKKDGDTLKVTAVFKYEDENAANAACNEIENAFEEHYVDINIDQDSEFVTVNAEIAIDDYLTSVDFTHNDNLDTLHEANFEMFRVQAAVACYYAENSSYPTTTADGDWISVTLKTDYNIDTTTGKTTPVDEDAYGTDIVWNANTQQWELAS